MRWMDGLDLYSANTDMAYNYVSNNFSAITFYTTGGRFGGVGISGQANFSAGAYYLNRILGSTDTELWVSIAANLQASGTGGASILVALGAGGSDNGGVELSLQYNNTNGTWTFTRPNNGSVASFVHAVAAGWHWIDWRAKYGSTTGELELWVDDVQIYSATGLNVTDHSGLTGWTAMYLYGNGGWILDDVFVYTPGTRLGDSRIEALVPTSDASPNQGTPSTGTSHYAVVDDVHIDLTDYITMPNTSGDKEVFGASSITGAPVNVWAVALTLVSQKSDAGSFQLEPLVISSGSEAGGSAMQLLTSWSTQHSIFEQDPHTSAAWSYAAVNAMDIGFKVA